MKEYSTRLLESLRLNVFLDTNILSYLVDDTYPHLSTCIHNLSQLCCVDIISSDFCQIEFMGIRKREHYLRLVVENAQRKGKALNLSSLLKYHNQFECDEVNFEDVLSTIENNVKDDLTKIVSDYGISFRSIISNIIPQLTREICLKSKISKEDSFVLASASGSDARFSNVPSLLLTNDRDFVKWYKEQEDTLRDVFKIYGVTLPVIVNIKSFFGVDLQKNDMPKAKIQHELSKMIIDNNKSSYLGTSFCPQKSILSKTPNIIAFHALNTIYQDRYICELSADLQTFVSVPSKTTFYHKNQRLEDKVSLPNRGDNLVTTLVNNKEEILADESYQKLLEILHQDGNYVFYME